MKTNTEKAKLIREAVENAGADNEDHYLARQKIIPELINTKIPIVKICQAHLPVDDNYPPYELDDKAKSVFRDIAFAIENSECADLSDTADYLLLTHDIKLRP